MADKWKHTALLVIDMQNDFILEDGLMRVNGGKAIVPNVIKAVEIARQRGILVVWVNCLPFFYLLLVLHFLFQLYEFS
ncbi:hypothetical protein CRYUN_Cryun31cG0084800 [Craigia yunnanensis]